MHSHKTSKRLLTALLSALSLLLLPACETKEVSEAELKAALEAAMPNPLVVFVYDDFDGDGKKEAFGVCAREVDTVSFGKAYYNDCQIWYADRKGATPIKTDGRVAELYGFPKELMVAGKQKLFCWMVYAGGSGSTYLCFGVRRGKPYELKISGQYNYLEKQDGEYIGRKSDFTRGWHDEALFFFRFDDRKGEFIPTQPKQPKPVEKIELTLEEQLITVDKTYMLDVRIAPDDAYNKIMEWESSDPDVIGYEYPSAYFTPKAPGTATITARATDGSDVSASIVIIVVE